MKMIATLAFVGLAGLCAAGGADAMPIAPASTASVRAPIVEAAIVVTKTVRRGPMGRRIVTKRVVRRGPMGGTVVTTRRVVR